MTTSEINGGDHELKYRQCDDMLTRRFAGNSSQLKKPNMDSHKQFITPIGNPMQYVQKHKKSVALDEMQDEKTVKDRERDERNSRYEEMEKLKDKLKEEEEQWTSKLDKWKQRRRSATFDVRQRSEERQSIMLQRAETATPRRRAKTYREIVEDKKKRDAGLSYYSGGDADPMSSFDFSSNDDLFNERKNSSTKKLYRGAASVPTVVLRNKDDTDAIAQPHATEETSDNESTALSSDISNPTSPANPPQATTSLPVVTNRAKNGSTLRISTSDQNVFNRNPNQSNNNNRHLENKPHALINSSALHSHQNKESLSLQKANSQPLPLRYSTSTASDSSDSETKTPSRVGFASSRNMWENMSALKNANSQHRSVPIDLSALLKRDDEKLQLNGASSHSSAHSEDSSIEQPSPTTSIDGANHLVHKPKIMGLSCSRTKANASRLDLPHSQHTFEPIHKYGNTLPSKLRISSLDEKIKQKEQENSLRLNISGLKGPAFTPRLSPRSGVTGLNSLFEDLNISIIQRPKCERGFGFTVRGGDDGKPVVVNTVSPGGAADACHLHVGDEILAINEVRLSDALTQDDIVQLIVESVITGNLSLAVRRYGKSKKNSPRAFLGGFKASGSVLPIRSSKEIFSRNQSTTSSDSTNGFPSPSSHHHGDLGILSKAKTDSTPQSKWKLPHDSLFRNQTMTSNPGKLFSGKENKREDFSTDGGSFKSGAHPFNSMKNPTEPLKMIIKEWTAWPNETHQPPDKHGDSAEVTKRGDERNQTAAQLKKTETAKLEQEKRLEKQRKQFHKSKSPSLYDRIFNSSSRLAREDDAVGNGRKITGNNLSNHVIGVSKEGFGR